jgi:hypothetical protein
MMYEIDVPRDGYVTEKVREVGSDQVTLSKVSTCCYETQVNGTRMMLMLACGPLEMAPANTPTLFVSDQDVIWCTSASKLEWVPLPHDWESVSHAEGWWVRKESIPAYNITLV